MCHFMHSLHGLGIAIAVLGAIVTTLSGLSRICNSAGRAAHSDDAVMYYSEGLYMAQRRFALFSRGNAPDPDEVMQVCVNASNLLDPNRLSEIARQACIAVFCSCSCALQCNMLYCACVCPCSLYTCWFEATVQLMRKTTILSINPSIKGEISMHGSICPEAHLRDGDMRLPIPLRQ